MADISEIQLSDNTLLNLKDTQARNALSESVSSGSDISVIQLSDSTEYNIKDAQARQNIETITTDVKTQVNADKDLINNGNDFIDDETLDEYSDKIEEMQEAYKKYIPIQTESGTEIQIDNSGNDKALVDIGLDGNTEQTATTGKNKLPSVNTTRTINGITFTHNEDGTITANGTATDNALYPIAINGTETGLKTVSLPAGTYKVVDGIGDYTNYFTQMTNNSSFWLNTGATGTIGVSPTQTLNSTTDVTAFLYIRNGKTANNLIFKPMILLDSVTDLSYEKYTGRNCKP